MNVQQSKVYPRENNYLLCTSSNLEPTLTDITSSQVDTTSYNSIVWKITLIVKHIVCCLLLENHQAATVLCEGQ